MNTSPAVHHQSITIDDVDIFYRSAGPEGAPVVVLLHGFPSSSHQYRHLLPFLAERFRVIAPDYPGFGLSAMPPRENFSYTFARYAEIVGKLLGALRVDKFALYMMDYGVPVGLRLAMADPKRVTALVAQNGAPYGEAFGPFWDPLRAFWADNNETTRAPLAKFLQAGATQFLYTAGVTDPSRVDPTAWIVDQHFLDRPGNAEIQFDLFYDNRTNGALFGDMQAYLRDSKPPTLILWGKNDPVLDVAGAQAYLRDLPNAELLLIDSGHCALEDRLGEMAPAIFGFYSRVLIEHSRTPGEWLEHFRRRTD